MDENDQIAFANLQGEVTVLRYVLGMIVNARHLDPKDIQDAFNNARALHAPLSKERVAIDNAINRMTQDGQIGDLE